MDTLAAPEMQVMLRDTLRRFLDERYGFDVRRALLKADRPFSAAVWESLANELGVLGAAFSQEAGGLGGSAEESAIIMEEFGRSMVVEPYVSSVVIGGGLLSRLPGGATADLLQKIIIGEALIAFAHAEPGAAPDRRHIATTARADGDGFVVDGFKTFVYDAPLATHLIVSARTAGAAGDDAGLSLFVVDVADPGIIRNDCRTLGGSSSSEIRFERVRVGSYALVGPEGTAAALIDRVLDEAVAAICSEAVGLLERLVADTVEYTKQRRQFGKAIAQFQVLQHAMVDMHIAAQEARAITGIATSKLEGGAAERAAYVSAAKVRVARACRSVSQAAVQLHGGMGMTDELAIGHLFRRAMMIESQFGTTEEHRRRFERLCFELQL